MTTTFNGTEFSTPAVATRPVAQRLGLAARREARAARRANRAI